MEYTLEPKKIVLVAHDNKVKELIEWAKYNKTVLAQHEVLTAGTNGALLEQELACTVIKLQCGLSGSDQQSGAKIAAGGIDFLVFFWDPLEPQPHDPDVKALLRIAVVWNIPIAFDRASADGMISPPLMLGEYQRLQPNCEAYVSRVIG